MTKTQHRGVRTTINLDDDIWTKLKAEVRRSGRPFKTVINELLRLALAARRLPSPVEPFLVRARPLGQRSGLDYDRVSELIEQVEEPL